MAMKGADRHIRRLKRLSREASKVAGAIVEEGADTIRAYAYQKISAGSASGQSGGKHQHQPSRPGEFPNRELGDLQTGLKVRRTGPLTAEVRAEAKHSAPLEFGTSRMQARPFLRPSRDAKKPEIEKRFAEQMSKVVKQSG